MDIQNLVPVDYSNQRVLTTAQVAAVFETTPYRIRDNFRYAKKHFVEGRDYFKVEGEDLKALKGMLSDVGNSHSAAPIPQFANSVILYTEQGVARHCKMLNTKKVLERFAELKRDYFQSVDKPAVTPSNEPQLFTHPQFGNLRVIIIDGEIWFVGSDVARALGYKDTDQALRDHVPDKFKITRRFDGFASPRGFVLINEAGLYKLIMRSKLPKAEEFSDWTCGEVLPSIRKYGCYSVKGEMSLFPDEQPSEKKVTRRPVPELAFVYGLEFSNGMTKIGVAKDLTARMKDLQKETKSDIVRWAASALMTRDKALLLERTLKVKFFDCVVGGEFFNAPFAEVKAALQESPVDKLLAIADRMEPSPEKNNLLNQAAAIILS